MGHDEDHDIESAAHNTGFFKTSSSSKKMTLDGDQWNVSVISQEELQSDEPTWCQLMKVGGGHKNIAQYLRTRTERGSNHQTSDGQIQLTIHTSEDNF